MLNQKILDSNALTVRFIHIIIPPSSNSFCISVNYCISIFIFLAALIAFFV